MITVTISDKGQITLPSAVRKKLGLAPRRKMEIEVRGNEIVMRPMRSISDLAGIFHERAKHVTDDWETIRTRTEIAVAEEVAREGMD